MSLHHGGTEKNKKQIHHRDTEKTFSIIFYVWIPPCLCGEKSLAEFVERIAQH
jgi:hypothetical protein